MMSEEISTKDELIEASKAARFKLEELLSTLNQTQVLAEDLDGGWSVKDVLAHIVAWEDNMVRWVGQALDGETPSDVPPDDDAVNALNEELYIGNKNRDLTGILREFKDSYQRALQATKEVPEEILFNPNYFEWRKGRPLWYMIAANMIWHYQEHTEQLQAHFGESS
jgi:hypothetical protein